MKKILYILCAALGLGSCNYLDIEPVGQVIPHKTSEFRALLTEGYSRFPYFDSKAYLCLLSDEVGSFHEGNIYGNDGAPLVYNYTWQYGRQMREFPYQQYYSSIFHANAVLANLPDAEEDTTEESKNQIMAEAYSLRAYSFFDLVNLYGAPYDPATAATDRTVPLATYIDIEQRYPTSTVAAVYTQILNDIAAAENLMEVEQQTTELNYRFTKNALTAFKARVKLYMGAWQEAYELAASLLPAYELVDLNALGQDAPLPWETASPEIILGLERPFYGAQRDLIGACVLSDGMLALIDEATDNRRAYLRMLDDGDWIYGPNDLGLGVDRNTSTRVSIRIAEMYLIAAETGAHLPSELSNAKEHLLALQSKRFKPEAMDARRARVEAMDAEALLQEVADERARELLMEGHRWFDLRRTTRPAITKTHGGSPVELRANDSRYTLPFPQSAIDANPELSN